MPDQLGILHPKRAQIANQFQRRVAGNPQARPMAQVELVIHALTLLRSRGFDSNLRIEELPRGLSE
jgi:hypothetical protein